MKKLILDACSKTAFSFNNKFYKQIDGVSMRSPLGSVLANIIMAELESTVVKELVDKSIIKLYMRNVDDTLLLVKEKDIPPGFEIRTGSQKFPAVILIFPATKSLKTLKFPVRYSEVLIDISTEELLYIQFLIYIIQCI